MSHYFKTWLTRAAAGVGVATMQLLLAVCMASAADPVPPKPPAPKDTAKEADRKQDAKADAKDAKNATKDADRAAAEKEKSAKDATDKPRVQDQDANAAKDRAKDTADRASDKANDARSAAKDRSDDADDHGPPAADRARDSAEGSRDRRDGARDSTRDARDARRNDEGRDRDNRDRRHSLDPDSGARGQFRADNVRSADVGIWFDRSSTNALVISDLSDRGPVAQLGFQEGDRIVSVNGQRVTREADFIQHLFAEDVRNDRVKVIVLRDGREEIIFVEPAVLIEDYSTPQHDPMEQFGIVIDDRYNDRIVVWKVVPRSPAFYAGIRAGDVITTFHGQPVKSHQQFVQTVQTLEPGQVDVVVDRAKKARTFQVDYPQRADVERPNQRHEERIEDRIDRRDDRKNRPGAVEVTPNRDVTVPATQSAPQPAPQPSRGRIVPRRSR